MRRILLGLMAVVAVLLATASAGCDNKIIADNARNSAAGFLTGVFSSAVNAALAEG